MLRPQQGDMLKMTLCLPGSSFDKYETELVTADLERFNHCGHCSDRDF
jgi:hypothetical protein